MALLAVQLKRKPIKRVITRVRVTLSSAAWHAAHELSETKPAPILATHGSSQCENFKTRSPPETRKNSRTANRWKKAVGKSLDKQAKRPNQEARNEIFSSRLEPSRDERPDSERVPIAPFQHRTDDWPVGDAAQEAERR